MTRRRALIVGGSMGGLFAALALRQKGWHVEVYERTAGPLTGRGAGIVTHARLNAALQSLGLPVASERGIAIATRRLFGADGQVLREIAAPQVNTSWDSLLQTLRAGVPDDAYHPGRSVTSAVMAGDKVIARFADGATAEADLLVAADGVRSGLRTLIYPRLQPTYAGYVAWRGMVEERALSRPAHQALMTSFAFCLPAGEQMLGYPVAGADNAISAGHRRYNFVWYRQADGATLARLLTDETGHRHAVSVPPPLVARAVIEEMRAAAVATLAPAFAEAVAAAEMPFFQPIYDLAVPSMVTGRVVFLGDAAFIARPHVGGGVTKAAEDACALAVALARGDIDEGLAAFDRERHARGQQMVQRGRDLGAKLDHAAAAPAGQIDILRDTASLAFLD